MELLENRYVLAAAVDLAFATNGLDANTAPGPAIRFGEAASWTYQVANTGTVALSNVKLVDDGGTPTDMTDDFSPSQVLAITTARGTLEATFNLSVARFATHPTLPYLYASVPSANSVAIINTQTLEQEALIFVGSGPRGMALSADGSRLYVANSTSNFVGVIDTQSRTALPSILVAEPPGDVEVGADGRLYVLGNDHILQINPATGQSAGPNIGSSFMVYSGELAISPNKDRLYYADYGLSPASLYQFNLTTDPPTLMWESPHGGLSGSNGQDLAISSDGSFVSYACGSGQGGYVIAKYRTSDMAILGTFNTGAYPREITFSPDGAVAYTVHTSGQIETWDTSTFLPLGIIATTGESTEIVVDRTNSHVFAALGSQLRVYATGRGGDINTGDTNRDHVFDPGEKWSFASQGVAKAGQQTKQATITADDALGNAYSDQDLSYYLGLAWQIDVEGAAGGQDADQPSGPTIRAGNGLSLTYAVTNPGLFSLANVVLTDHNGTDTNGGDDFHPALISGDTDADNLLDPGETWLYSASAMAQAGLVAGHVTATALAVDSENRPLPNGEVTDSDPTYYLGGVVAVSVRTTASGVAANFLPGPHVPAGSPLALNYQVENTGNLALSNVTVQYDAGTPDNSTDDFSPAALLAPPVARGTLEMTYDLGVSRFVVHPTLPYLYASVASANSVAIFNTQTLELEKLIFIGSGPLGMALSLDGSRLYVANASSNSLGVIDTQSRTALPSITLPEQPRDVEVGADGRLYVLGEDHILQIDPATGQSAGANVGAWHIVFSGELAISPNKDRLYYADYGLSPASLYQFDLTTNPPTLLWESPHGGLSGSNGQDLAISSDGSFVSYACGAGQGGYVIAKYRTSDMSILGTFNTGAYPREITFSPDGAMAYTVHTSGQIGVWDTTTFLSQGTITTSGEAHELFVDRTGGHLFAAFGSQLRVYSTGLVNDYNLGDVNRNRLLDPGESWSYQANSLAASGQFSAGVTVTATDSLNGPATETASTHYVGIEAVREVDIPENSAGELIGPAVETRGELVPSDSRFEIVDAHLKLKADQFLLSSADDGMIVELRSVTTPTQTVQTFLITVTSGPSPWQNVEMPMDVDGDKGVVAADALEIVNCLNAFGARRLGSGDIASLDGFLDVDGDRWVTAADALMIINFLNAFGPMVADGEGESAAVDLFFLQLGDPLQFSPVVRKPRR